MRTTLTDLNLTEKDFKVEIIEIVFNPNVQVNSFLGPFECNVTTKVNGNFYKFSCSLHHELIYDISYITGTRTEEIIDEMIKSKAIQSYINDIKFLRKQKLEKLNERI